MNRADLPKFVHSRTAAPGSPEKNLLWHYDPETNSHYAEAGDFRIFVFKYDDTVDVVHLPTGQQRGFASLPELLDAIGYEAI